MKAKLGVLCALLGLVVNAQAAIFLKLDDVLGESQARGHENEIEILSWAFAMSNSGTAATAGGAGAGKVTFQDLSLTKLADTATPVLMLSTANGKVYKQAILTLERAGERPFVYYRVTMENVIVTSVSTGGSGAESRPTESISLNFAKVKVEYIPMKADGGAGTPVVFTWNLATNTP